MSYYKCSSCDAKIDDEEDDPITLYECGNCGTIFSRDNSADGCSHKCPDCNKFSSKLTELGCPECEEGELEEIDEAEFHGDDPDWDLEEEEAVDELDD